MKKIWSIMKKVLQWTGFILTSILLFLASFVYAIFASLCIFGFAMADFFLTSLEEVKTRFFGVAKNEGHESLDE